MASLLSPPASGNQHLYCRHRPEETALYPLIEANLALFLEHLCEREAPLPRFVTDEFKEYLRCGRLEQGFVRVKCDGCRHEHLVGFSCKCRGSYPSCGARRMVETSAHLIDHVLPAVLVRQWVLSFPWPLRLLFANRPAALTRALAIVTRAIESALIRQAGLSRKSGARGGIVTLIQRFGSSVNLNVHLHMLALDGVFVAAHGKQRFRDVAAPDAQILRAPLDRIITRTSSAWNVMVCWSEIRSSPGWTWKPRMLSIVSARPRSSTALPWDLMQAKKH